MLSLLETSEAVQQNLMRRDAQAVMRTVEKQTELAAAIGQHPLPDREDGQAEQNPENARLRDIARRIRRIQRTNIMLAKTLSGILDRTLAALKICHTGPGAVYSMSTADSSQPAPILISQRG